MVGFEICRLGPALTVSGGLLLSGVSACAPTQWTPGPGQTAAAFEPAKGNCEMVAQGADQGLVAVGSPQFVGSAQFGNSLGNAMREKRAFKACMRASGFVVVDEQMQARVEARKAEVKEILDRRRECFGKLRVQPAYADIVGHLSDPVTHAYTIEQMSDKSMPSPDQERELASYADKAHVCQSAAVTALNNVLPAAAQVIEETTEKSDSEAIAFAQGRMTWGQFASGEHEITMQSKTAFSHVSLL